MFEHFTLQNTINIESLHLNISYTLIDACGCCYLGLYSEIEI